MIGNWRYVSLKLIVALGITGFLLSNGLFSSVVRAVDLYFSTGTIEDIQSENLIIQDSTLRLADNVEYLNGNDEIITNIALRIGDIVSYQASTQGVIVQLKRIGLNGTVLSNAITQEAKNERPAQEKGAVEQNGDLKFVNGVWSN